MKILDLINSIREYRKDMYDVAKNKGISHPDVLKISQQLDKKIILFQSLYIK